MIVRAGSRVVPGVGPLIPTRSWTIEGPERFGGSRVPTGGAGAWGGGLWPVGLRGFTSRGLGAGTVVTVTNPRTGQSNSGLSGNFGDYGPMFQPGDTIQINISGLSPSSKLGDQIWFYWPGAPVLMSGLQDAAGNLLGFPFSSTPDASGSFSFNGPITSQMAGAWVIHAPGGQAAGWQVQSPYGTNAIGQQKTAYEAGAAPLLSAGTPYYQQMPQQNIPITGTVPTTTPQTLAQQLGSNVLAPTGQIVAQAVTAGQRPSASIVSGSVAFSNLTTGNASVFNVGDSWRVSITGASPNQAVVVTGTQNGKSSTSQLGVTDSNGAWSSTGTMDASTIGNWTEAWTVGGVPAASLSFTVQAAGGGTGTPSGSAAMTPAGALDLSSVSSVFTGSAIGGIPNWALIAAGLGLVFVLGGHKK